MNPHAPPARRSTALTFLAVLGSALVVGMAGPVRGAAPAPLVSLKEQRESGVVMQEWETSCAAASVATVLTFGLRDPVSEREAAAAMLAHTDPARVRAQGGFSLLDMKRFVESRGYRGAAYRGLSFDDLRLFQAPIVAIDQFGFNHYVVFDGARGDTVRLADPAFGRRELSRAEFEAVWINGLAFVISR